MKLFKALTGIAGAITDHGDRIRRGSAMENAGRLCYQSSRPRFACRVGC